MKLGAGRTSSMARIFTSSMNPEPERELDEHSIAKLPDRAATELLPPAVDLDAEQIDDALGETGLSSVNIKRYKALEKMGRNLQRQGAMQVGMGELIYSNQIRMELIQNCRSKIRSVQNPVDFCAYAHVLNTALSSKDAATKELLKTAQSEHFEDPNPRLPAQAAPKGQRIVAVQINNTVAPPPKKQ